MARGLPDYYNPDTLVSQRLANVEEVVTAVRGLGSLDNRGRTLTYDDFATTLPNWFLVKAGDGVTAVISTDEAYLPPSSAYLDGGTTGGNGISRMNKYVQLGASEKIGLETAVLYRNDAPEYQVYMTYNPDGNDYKAHISILPASGVIRIGDGDNWDTIGNVGYNADGNPAWIPVKLVADFENGVFVRALIGQKEYDLSAYSLTSSAIATPGLARAYLRVDAANAVTNDGYFGYAALTVDEP